MSSPLSHLSLAVVAWPSLRAAGPHAVDALPWWRKGLLLGWVGFGLMAPDLDAVPAALGVSTLGATHNGFAHSLAFAALFAPVFAVIGRFIAHLPRRGLLLAGLLCYASHVLTDAITYGRGVMLLWPWTDARYGWPILYGVRHSQPEELLHTLPITIATDLLFGLVVFALFRAVAPLPAPTRLKDDGSRSGCQPRAGTLVDAHVHLHEAFDLARTFDAAVRRFDRAAGRFEWTGGGERVLMLTESWGANVFADLKAGRRVLPSRWALAGDDESASLYLRRGDGAGLQLIAGRQIVTAERLEVLALACGDTLDDGQPIDAVLDWCRQRDAVAVIPWGFGKWTGRRGQVVQRLIERAQPGSLLLGDNAGRLNLGATPKLLRLGAARGLGILPGSDPLPFRGQQTKAGRYGFVLAGACGSAQALRRELRALRGWPATFGRLDTPLAFLWYQSAMQWRIRLRKASRA